ncbi:MAG TPA: TolC family protein [Gemmataceae bacterium]|nr:TolC family protein [Gemmataceae bacterium]
MGIAPHSCHRLACLAGLASCLLPLTAFSQTPGIKTSRQVAAAPPSNPPATPTLTLADCLRIAHERQPALQAYRASLAAAEDGSQALQNLPRLAGLFAKDIPIRKEQACLGIEIATARLEQAERETTYAVTRTYFAILFARDQKKVANKVVTELNDALENAKRLVQGGAKKPTQNDVERTEVYLGLAQLKMEEADTGSARAMAGLREAMGVGPNFAFEIAGEQLPELDVKVNKQEIIALAMSRRAELTQASLSAQVTNLEVDAQGRSRRKKVPTYATGSDIHANPIPQGIMDDEYRPGAVGLEMPPSLVGKKRDRQARAEDLSDRAGAVVDKARNLITLEAEDAYLKWQQNSTNAARARGAADRGDKLAQRILEDFKALGEAVDYKEVLEARVLASQARAAYNEAKFKVIVALAALERITGGGFHAGLAASK